MEPTRIALAAWLLCPGMVLAQSAAAPPAVPMTEKAPARNVQSAEPQIQKVEVKGSASHYDPRRDDTAGKTVLNSDEITRYGDSNVFEVLKRAPGVTVIGNTIRMRGLGAGYTQILVNGDRPPPGFSLDALTPDQIERIEVIRSASAEYSMQSIAGTINIILRKLVARPQHDLRVSGTRSAQGRNGTVSGTWAEKAGALSYFLNGAMYAGHNTSSSWNQDRFTAPSGTVQQLRESMYSGAGSYEGFVLFPRLALKLDNGDDLNLQAGAQANRSNWEGRSKTDNLAGSFPAPDWIESLGRTPSTQRMLRGELGWVAKRAGGKLDLNVSAERSRNTNDSGNDMYTEQRALHLERDWNTTTRAQRYGMRTKFTRSFLDSHSLASGFETSLQKNDETRDRHEQLGDAAPSTVVETFEPRILRAAAYAQDEWSISRQLSIYLGMRWEGVQTDSAGTGLASIQSRNHVLSPVVQTLYKLPGTTASQLRLALTRTYKAPTLDQLTARRYEAVLNTRFSPDSSGNPALQPELANGIDVGFEHFWSQGGLFSVSASRRTITDYIRTRLDEDAQGRWLYQPLNDGTAQVRSLEAEIKLPLRLVYASATGFDLRASATRNWSQVDTVPGPDNRLDAQTPLSANFGIDYSKGKLSLGTSLAYQQGGWVQMSEAQSQRQQSRRDMDAYALWKLDPRFQLRLSLANILGMNNTSERVYADAAGISRQVSFQPGSMRTGLNLEMKL